MPLVNMNKMLADARRDKRAVAAINFANYETLSALVTAAELEKSPVIVQVYQRLMGYPHMGALMLAARKMAEDASVDVALHLDHGASLEQVKKAIDLGFSSVMLDGSKLPLEENIRTTREAVGLARKAGVSCEGEIGLIPSAKEAIPTCDADEAIRFAKETGVDALAAAIGTAHGFYKEEPTLDLELARRIHSETKIPLVLHGGTGVPERQIIASIGCGVAKVNIATEYQNLFLQEVGGALKRLEGFKPVDLVFAPVEEKLVEFARKTIRMLAGK